MSLRTIRLISTLALVQLTSKQIVGSAAKKRFKIINRRWTETDADILKLISAYVGVGHLFLSESKN